MTVFYSNRARKSAVKQRGQAIVEFAFVFVMMLILLFGIIDFSLAIYDKQVMTNLTREGSNLASRGTSLADTMTALNNGKSSLKLGTNGKVILTSVKADSTGKVFTISGQLIQTCSAGSGCPTDASKVGTGVGNGATVPAGVLQANQTIYVTEIYYMYVPTTPVGGLLKNSGSLKLYDVAYF